MTNTEERLEWSGRKRQWTVMVYMAAEKSLELDAVAVEDLKEMEEGVNQNSYVAVQINRAWPAVPQRYEIQRSGPKQLSNDNPELTNTGKPETLASFLRWAVRQFPAHNYCLVLWGHAYGLGFGRDHDDPLTLKELSIALQAFRDEREQYDPPPSSTDRRLELLGANACAMSYVEAAYEVRQDARYLVASQISVPLAGWPYKTILSRITDQTEARDLGTLVADAYVSHYNALLTGDRVSMTLLELEKADVLQHLLRDLTEAMRSETSPGGRFSSAGLDGVRDVCIAAASGDVRPLIDFAHLCKGFSGAESEPLRSLSKRVPVTLEKLVHHVAHPDLDDLHGLGLFVPFVTDKQDLRRLGLLKDPEPEATSTNSSEAPDRKKTDREEYQNLSIFQSPRIDWPTLVYDELRREIPGEVMSYLTGIVGATRQERRDITQIVLSIDSAFNKLDRILANSRACIAKKLREAPPTGAPETSKENPPPTRRKTRFGPPYLRLIRPPSLEARVRRLNHLRALGELQAAAKVATGIPTFEATVSGKTDPVKVDIARIVSQSGIVQPPERPDTDVVDSVVEFFEKVENAVGELERAVRKGLTNAKFGLGPAAPGQFSVGEPSKFGDSGEQPKSQLGDSGEQPKSQLGDSGEQPKSQLGPSSPGAVTFTGDLRVDLAFRRVVELFSQVGQVLQRLEQATLEVEITARDMLSDAEAEGLDRTDLLVTASAEIDRGFRILQEASTNARRTVRRVLSHPVYGVGPASSSIGIEERQALASAGGLDQRNLRLL